MRDSRANPDAPLAEIAARQHGVVGVSQLRELGLDKRAVHRRASQGRLHRVHMGVYAVGHPRLSFEGRCLAAVLACGGGPGGSSGEAGPPSAAVSHRSAAALWGMLPEPDGWVEVSVPTANGRKQRRGLVVHRSASLAAGVREAGERLVVEREGIAVTAPARTLRDLRRAAPTLVQRALRRALDLRLVPADVLGPEPDLTRSELERLFLALCRRHGLPAPEVNARVNLVRGGGPPGHCEMDFLWPEQRVVVETDGWRHHSDRAAFEADRAKDVALEAAGYRVLRFTYRQIADRAPEVAAALLAFLRPRPGG